MALTVKKTIIICVISIFMLAASVFMFGSSLGNKSAYIDPSDKQLVADGKQIYAKNCASCHGAKLEGQPDWRTRQANGRYLYSLFICNNKQTDRRRNYSGHTILSDALDLADFDIRASLLTSLRKRPVVSPCWAWRLSSKTRGINQALSNAYLKSQGLYELRNGWIKFHHS